MCYNIIISREPRSWREPGRPLLLFRPETVRRIIAADPEFHFIPSKDNTGFGTIHFIGDSNNQDIDIIKKELCFTGSGLIVTSPSETLMKKLALLATKLQAHLQGYNGEHYFLDENGEIGHNDTPDFGLYIIGDTGHRYELTGDGFLKNLNQIPDYLAENMRSFSERDQEKFNLVRNRNDTSGKIYGFGGERCEAFTQASDSQDHYRIAIFYTWFQGVVSALNYLSEDKNEEIVYERKDPVTLDQNISLLLGYCRRYPQRSFMSACLALTSMRRNGVTSEIDRLF